jgi:hypothetical protein
LVEQWRGLHGLTAPPTATEMVAGQLRRVWRNGDGVEVIEEYVIGNMGHGTPIHATKANQGEAAGPYMLDVGISSTRRILAFWNLDREAGQVRENSQNRESRQSSAAVPRPDFRLVETGSRTIPENDRPAPPPAPGSASKVQEVIEKALRSAGLMK